LTHRASKTTKQALRLLRTERAERGSMLRTHGLRVDPPNRPAIGALLVLAAACSLLWPVSPLRAQDFELDAPDTDVEAPRAEPTATTTRNPLEDAREHMERGQALYGAGRYIESAEEFLRAYEAQPFSAFLFNAGVAYEKVDDPGRAADYFARFLQTDPQAENAGKLNARIDRLRGLSRAREAELAAEGAAQGSSSASTLAELEAARARLAEVQQQLAALGGKDGFKSLLSVQTTPSDADVLVKGADGNVIYRGSGPKFTQTLDPGAYVVEVQHAKYTAISAPITVAPAVVNVVLAEMSQGQFLGFLRVQTDVPGANVYVDEREAGALGRTPFQNPVKVGKHHLWIEKPGYQVVERDIDIGVGEDPLVKLELERVDYGRIRVVASRPDAEVYVDGRRIGRVPIETDVKHGKHRVVVSAEGMKDWKEDVTVERGQATPLRVRLRPKMGRKGAWATAAVAAGFLGAAIATGVVGKGLYNDLDSGISAGTLQSNDSRRKKGEYFYIASDVGYVIAGGMAALSTWYFVRDPLPDSEGRVLQPRDWAFNSSLARPQAHFDSSLARLRARDDSLLARLRARFDADVAPDRVGGHLHVSF
jgi:hypothetical protein